ncbi:peptidase M50 [Methyloradius palustris]|uniref:Peptidase M50 n=2 Tax=Methyloradius palustris TaxID=2778876 RepID=A0A8D5GAD2_9PROT|nr:peptidase M50 [Methyloradius palustris]
MMELTFIQKIAIYALPVIFAITVHEAAHGYVARYFGDMTAQEEGRISLNPIKHIDLVGTIVIPAISLLLGGILFGWAKPVPVNFSRLRHPKKDMLWVAAAGPAANLVMALFWAVLYKYSVDMGSFATPAGLMAQAGIMINIVLMVLNLLPIPPLDGGRIAVSLLPNHLAYRYAKVEQYGFIILIILLFTGVLSQILHPFIEIVAGFIQWLIL